MNGPKTLQTGLYLFSAGALLSSFFISDNKKAVKRRWIAVAAFGGAWAVELMTNPKGKTT